MSTKRDPYIQKNQTKPDPQIAKEMNLSAQWTNNGVHMIAPTI